MQRREAQSKEQREKYTKLNAEFQRMARRDKKDFLSEQCKEIEKTIELERLEISSRKLDTKGIFNASVSHSVMSDSLRPHGL